MTDYSECYYHHIEKECPPPPYNTPQLGPTHIYIQTDQGHYLLPVPELNTIGACLMDHFKPIGDDHQSSLDIDDDDDECKFEIHWTEPPRSPPPSPMVNPLPETSEVVTDDDPLSDSTSQVFDYDNAYDARLGDLPPDIREGDLTPLDNE